MPTNMLERLRATQRYPAGQDNYVSRRQTEIDTGLDDMVEDVDSPDAFAAQQESFERTGFAPARADLRSSVLTKLRNTLKVKTQEHQRVMERERQKAEIEAASQERQNAYQTDRFNQQQDRMDQRQATQIEAGDSRQERLFRQQQGLLDDRQQFQESRPPQVRGGNPTDAMLKRYEESRTALNNPGPMSRLGRMLGVSDDTAQRQAYEASLSDILVRSGKFDTVNEVVRAAAENGDDADGVLAELEAAGIALDPYEREYLTLKLGRRAAAGQ
jgi:hypothetical protein